MIPIGDDNPTRSTAFVTWAIIGLCAVVFLWQQSLSGLGGYRATISFGLIPAVLTGQAQLGRGFTAVPPSLTVFTSMFMHGGWGHIFGNLLYLYIFGNNIEERLGHGRYIALYLMAGVAAAAAQVIPDPASHVPMIGASGAISGVLGAYLILYPRVPVTIFVPIFFVFKVGARWVLGAWLAFQVVNGLLRPAEGGGVAWWAHVGGFVAGAFLVRWLARPVPPRPWG